MRRAAFGEGRLGTTMVIMGLDGLPQNRVVLMGKVCGDTFTKDGEDFVIIDILRLGLVLQSFCGTVV